MYSDTYHQFLRAVEAQDHDSYVHVAFQLEALRYVLVRDLLQVLKNENDEGTRKVRQLLLGAHEIAMHSGNEGARLAVLKMAKRLHSDATRTIYDSIVDPETNLGVRRIEAFLCWHTPTIRQLFGKPATFGMLTP